LLSRIIIQNYAIIEDLEISFSKSLNVLTGETGAGKSIIMGALGLILGERADSGVLLNKSKKCVVEAVFQNPKKEIAAFLIANDLDCLEYLIIRREIAAAGKSRAFINDTPVTLAQLNSLSHLLVDLHQQFDTLELTQNDFQRKVIDALAGNAQQLEQYETLFHNWKEVKKEATALLLQKQQFEKEADYHRFQFTELDEAGFKENELESIDASLKLLTHSESIKSALSEALFQLEESDTPIVQQLKSICNQINHFAAYHPQLPEIVQRLQTAQIELKDITGEISQISDAIQNDPKQIEKLNERLSLGYRLQKKHGVSSTEELIKIKNELEEKLQAVLQIDETILQKEKETARHEEELIFLSAKISERRQKQIKPLVEKVNKLLLQVGMPNAKLKVEIQNTSPGPTGADLIEFLFDANRSGQYQPVRKVASGGELSRLMLCIKSLVAQSMDMPTLIFDEIDTGISGEAARQVAIIMKELAINRQVICITHQPQIAGKAEAHLFVFKEIINDKVKTAVKLLSEDERITAIAKMLSGERPTAAALENAREMIMN
jgi:DNA repair protein RecN (Recombination protein N)